MSQRLVTDYFNSKKRPAGTNYVGVQKVLKCKKADITIAKKNAKNTKDLETIKLKLLNSDRLNHLRSSIEKFKSLDNKLKINETAQKSCPTLDSFSSIEFDVPVSPQKATSPKKLCLSPQKQLLLNRNLFNHGSPTISLDKERQGKDASNIHNANLPLPYRYKLLNEIFRSIDTITQLLFNRKEVISFTKLKLAVEEMTKRTLQVKHLGQIKNLYPEAFIYKQEKTKVCGDLSKILWDLTIIPTISEEIMTTEIVLNRRKTFYEILLENVKTYHTKFLLSLTPTIEISEKDIKRWHPEFDIENIPDIETAELPAPPNIYKCGSGKDILEKSQKMFYCNSRMHEALLSLKDIGLKQNLENSACMNKSNFKGIPLSLLEKVRLKQNTKALKSMTRSTNSEREIEIYSRLPEIARLTRNLFVTEKKSVLDLDIISEKLFNSYSGVLNKADVKQYLEEISKHFPKWLLFLKLRHTTFIKLAKDTDFSHIVETLTKLAEEKKTV